MAAPRASSETDGANDAAIAAIKPGITGADVYETAIRVFEEAGLAQYNVMNIVGHGSGVEMHETPWLGEKELWIVS
ncbi:MAG: M24 family metallopeptidase [Deltaproteobacteria bacterium]|nr:M24 family metallopeptidase [Deltaproteobacteria bacterium]